MTGSIRWKIVLIYSLVFLLALELMGVYTFLAIEDYYLNEYTSQLQSQGELLAGYSELYLTGEKTESPAALVETFSRSARAEITLLDAYGRVVASSVPLPYLQQNRLIQEEVTRVLLGNPVSKLNLNPQTGQRYQLVALPVNSGGQVVGALYITGSLEHIYSVLNDITWIMVSGGLLVMAVAFALSIILSRTITEPVQKVTEKAARIALGDFSEEIELDSADEIGRLGEVFNYMAGQLEKTLREISTEKSKIEAILNQMSDGLVVVDNQGTIMHINPAAREFLGLSPREEIIDRPVEEVLTGLFSAQELSLDAISGQPLAKEVVVSLPQGGKRVFKCQLTLFEPPEGSLSGKIILIHDVTREKDLVRMQQEFVANVSHELRTPLTTIKSYVETLLEGAKEDASTLEHFLMVVNRETERMVRLVRDLLKLSQFEFKQVRWKFAEEDLSVVLAEAVEEARQRCGYERQITLQCHPLPPVNIDRDRIKQVAANLLNNAINYTAPGGSIQVTVSRSNGGVEIMIADNGIGIPPEELPRVMERFYRVDKTRSRQRGGTGLGLTIAKEIIEGHRGRIWLESNPGEGTTVRIYLPSQPAEEGSEAGVGKN